MAPGNTIKMKQALWLAIACFLSWTHESVAASSSSIITQTLEFSEFGGVTGNKPSKSRSTVSHPHQAQHQNELQSKGAGFRAELIHRDSPLSSLAGRKGTTRLERLQLAVKRSRARAKALTIAATNEKLYRSSSSRSSSSKISPHDFTTPVASSNGAYVMQLKLGTPAQTFQAIADTGSDLVWVQCNPCSRCYRQQGPIFSPSSSSSYSKLSCSSQQCQQLSTSSCDTSSNCNYVYQYGDRSGTKGDFSTETISLTTTGGGSQQIANFAFGCGHTNVGSFGGAGGLVGLGQGPVSLTSQLGSVIQNRFSYCLVSFDDAPSKTSPLLFGSAASLPESGVKSTPILNQGSTYYYVGLGGISVGGQALGITFTGGTIFDSGTTLTLLEDSVYSAVKSAFQSDISLPTADGSSVGLDLCFDVTGLKSYQVPTLSLHFTDNDLNPPAANYFVLADSNTLCLAMGSSSGLGLSIIGNIMQQNYHVLYDRGASTISFAPAQCDTL